MPTTNACQCKCCTWSVHEVVRLPWPVRFGLAGEQGKGLWAWLTRIDDLGTDKMELRFAKPDGTFHIAKTLFEATCHVYQTYDLQSKMNGKAVHNLKSRWYAARVGTSQEVTLEVFLKKHTIGQSDYWRAEVPECVGVSSVCTKINTKPMEPKPQRRKTGGPKVRAQPELSADEEENAPRAPKTRAAASKRKTPRSISSLPPSHGYDVKELGGDTAHVPEILDLKPKWDQEVIEDLLRYGATPKLHGTHKVHQKVLTKIVQCTFVQPSGALVHDIWLPVPMVRTIYGKQASHLPR